MKITLGVSALIRNRAGSVLLIRRKNEPSRGQWALPGGALEPGESLEAACIREVLEETAVNCKVLDRRPIRVTEVVESYGHYVLLTYEAAAVGRVNVRAGDDALDARFFSAQDMQAPGVEINSDTLSIIKETQ